MKYNEKQRAITLRKTGQSIKEIARNLGVSKSSVSDWVRKIILTKKQQKMLALRGHSAVVVEKRRTTRLSNELIKRESFISLAEKDINKISNNELKIIGAMLYWAEGRKRGHRMVSFSNSDPSMIKVIMRFFREVCNVPESKFRGHIHLHSHLNVNSAIKYWSMITKIPPQQFYKTYCVPSISSKGKMDSLPNGTLDIHVCNVELFLKIMGWIRGITKKILKQDEDSNII
ncbi:MAG: helix-turn-helix domain containing protein [Candidatus Pacebacteria bacterium]|nr:helix-turn-helix domain containing protein [Candidatus Paceibacterota bacterium]